MQTKEADIENLYSSIFTRKSVRQYQQGALSEDELNRIRSFIQGTKPLFEDIRVQFEIVGKHDIYGIQSFLAPHYLIAFSQKQRGYYLNVGFMMQQIDLYIEFLGLGSCYLGLVKPSAAVAARSELEFVIVLAFGKKKSDKKRASSQIKRKKADEIALGNPLWLDAVRVAPSAMNGQPWYFICKGGSFEAYCRKQNRLKNMVFERLNGVDMGIALCHLDLAVRRWNKAVSYFYDKDKEETMYNGYVYTVSGEVSKNKHRGRSHQKGDEQPVY